MPRTVPAPPFDLESLVPEFAGLARETVLLYPRAGSPGSRQSSMGGPLLWPVHEPWPYCDQPGHWTADVRPDAVPMVPVIQLFARDVPWLEFPRGKDVVQLLWCPLIHEEDPAGVVLPRLYWRNEDEMLSAGLLTDVPAPDEDDYEEEFVPRPCTVDPTLTASVWPVRPEQTSS
ncbi:hypothetical protein [Streptomyces broussonetiae]|uniref:DUF1963 domain-containing protein n=1 Tax=Streptomyces broussonetiae TaxID=2686304 RepID=A0ABV5E6M3_9ACTN